MNSERRGVKLQDGAEIFEYNDRACYKYNAKIKTAGDSCKVVFYKGGIMCGYPKNSKMAEMRKESQEEKEAVVYDPKLRFEKTGRRARVRLHDLVKSNINKHKDFRGKKQTFKMLTLTFRDDVKDLAMANKEFNLFIKRLNYVITGEKGYSFLRYVAVSELQNENNRGVWHFHVLFFNLPFLPVSKDMVYRLVADGRLTNSYDVYRNIASIWGKGNVDVKKVSFSDSYDVAAYISKYVGKGMEGSFDFASDNGLLYKKRFLSSTGLIGPEVQIAFLSKEQRNSLFKYFKENGKHFKKGGVIGTHFESFYFKNDYIGEVFGFDMRASLKRISILQEVFKSYSYGFEV